jgi:hypothetical protein
MQQQRYCRKRCFLLDPFIGVIRRATEARIVQLEGSRSLARKQPLLEAVTKRLLVKTLRDGKDLACALVIVKCVDISDGAVMSCSSKSCVLV